MSDLPALPPQPILPTPSSEPENGGNKGGSSSGGGAAGATMVERRIQRVAPPLMYKVVLLNDDYTPMEFVITVIQEFFNKDRERATQMMLMIHTQGREICGIYTKDIAITKVDQVLQAAQLAGHPLQCVHEPA